MSTQELNLNLDPALIEEYFPFDEFREGQKEAIEKILKAFDSGKKYVMLEAPTGAGKSVIGMTVRKYFESSYYLTIQKILQTQIVKDFGCPQVIDLKGRNAYPCTYWMNRNTWLKHTNTLPRGDLKELPQPNKYIGCDEGVCKTRDKQSKCDICTGPDRPVPGIGCPYWERVREARDAEVAVMNFKSFLFQTTFSVNFGNRKLLIIDEAHRSEPELLDFIGISIMDVPFAPLRWPTYNTAAEYAEFIEEAELIDKVDQKARYALYASKVKEADEWNNLKFKLELFMNSDPTKWVAQVNESKTGASRILELKPIFLEDFAHNYLLDKADHVLMMSATILSATQMREMLSIPKEECYSFRMKNRFPVKNRPIFAKNVGSLSYKNKHKTYPNMIKEIIEICRRHKSHKGIIHSHNFEIANLIMDECPKDIVERILFQKNFNNKDDMLAVHAKSKNSIILAPAMHEGLDLKGDLSRFQVIAKVPYPNLGNNKQLKARMEASPEYYPWLTALKLVQSYGRSIRSETDWAITYILDSDFNWFVQRNRKMLPNWFLEAIQS